MGQEGGILQKHCKPKEREAKMICEKKQKEDGSREKRVRKGF